MEEKLNITANIPSEITKLLYKPLRATYPGSWEDFNAVIMYMGMIMCLNMWKEGMDILAKKGELPDDPKVREELRKALIAKLVKELNNKSYDLTEDSQLKKFVNIIYENFQRNGGCS